MLEDESQNGHLEELVPAGLVEPATKNTDLPGPALELVKDPGTFAAPVDTVQGNNLDLDAVEADLEDIEQSLKDLRNPD